MAISSVTTSAALRPIAVFSMGFGLFTRPFGDPERFTQFDDAFRRSFAQGTSLDGVWGIIVREKVQFDRVRYLSLPAVTPVDVLIEQHRSILQAVVDRVPDTAEGAIRTHMSEVLRITEGLAQRYSDLIVADC